MILVYILSVISAVVIVFASVFFTVIILNSIFILITGVPYVTSGSDTYPKLFEKVKISGDTVVYDLGCGNGEFLFEATKFRPRKCVGYELSPMPFFVCLVKSIFLAQGKVKVYWRDFLQADLRDADFVYLYLVGRVMPKVSMKLRHDLRPGTIVASKGSKLPDWEIDEEIILNEATGYGIHIYKVK